MKVCSLYGAGFYYIPGTDTCIKIGGYVRTEYYHNENGAMPTHTAIGNFSRATDTYGTRARGMISADVRTQTEYGTLRSYMRYGQQWTTSGNGTGGAAAVNFERAFIQFAGFTFGRTDSYFDFYSGARYGLTPTSMDSAVGPAGINVAAYTAQFGNGVSASLSLEDNGQRAGGVYDLGTTFRAAVPASGFAGSSAFNGLDTSGQSVPDIVANLRVDQAWGSAQIMGALHQVGGKYYGANNPANGHPGNEWGWAVGAGLTLNMPWNPRDSFSIQAAYSEGAIRYTANSNQNNLLNKSGGVALGLFSDGVFGPGSAVELTEAWSVTGAFEHYWTPSLRTSIIGMYMDVSYNGNAKALIAASGQNLGLGTLSNYNPDWSAWRVGSRTMWNPVANLDVGLEIFYSKVNTGFGGTTTGINNVPGTTQIVDQEVWTGAFRVQRNFWP